MELTVGQRWRWIFCDGPDRSDVIIEVTDVTEDRCSYKIVQVFQSNFTLDKVGRLFVFEKRFDLNQLPCSTFEYLEGQDKPQPNIDWNSEVIFSQVAPDGTLNAITTVTLSYPVEYISMTLKI